MRDLEFMAERSMLMGCVDVWMRDRETREIVTDLTYSPHPLHTELPPAPLRIWATGAQMLMDELWRCGLRPTEGTGSAGSLAATERHLADMRRLVFDEPRRAKP